MSNTVTVEQGNREIAEFMGLLSGKPEYPYTKPNDVVNYREPLYHSSWDWLMPVVEKIYLMREIADFIISPGKAQIILKNGLTFKSPQSPQNNTITEVWILINELIQTNFKK